jgi:hypothetical protein
MFGTSCDFHKSAKKYSKNCEPLYPWNELAAPRTLQIIENGP